MNNDERIGWLVKKSKTDKHELLLAFLEEYGLNGLSNATDEQLIEYINKIKEENQNGNV